MKLYFWLAMAALTATFPSTSAQGGCGFHFGSHRRPIMVFARPACGVVRPSLPVYYASPQMMSTIGTPLAPPVMAANPSAPTPQPAVQPAYEYNSGATGEPAYYYTYDESNKLVVTQWRDWLFRGGRMAGEPAPPLPLIGALRGR